MTLPRMVTSAVRAYGLSMLARWLLFAVLCGVSSITTGWPAGAQSPVKASTPPVGFDTEPPPADEPNDFDSTCMDEYGRRLCDPRVWRAIVGSLGLKPAEDGLGKDAAELRIFMVDGYSHDLPAMVFSDLRGREPRLDIYTLGWARPSGEPSFTVELGERDAFQAVRLARAATRSPISAAEVDSTPPADADEVSSLVICLHPWTTVIEVIEKTGVTRRIRNGCHTDDLFRLAASFGDRALAYLPECQILEAGRYRGAHGVIDSCATLSGDIATAAQLRMKIDTHDVRSWAGAADPDLPAILADDLKLRLEGRDLSGAEARAALSGFTGTQFTGPVRAASSRDVTLEGEIMRYDPPGADEPAALYAPVTQRWVRQGGDWRLAEMQVGAFAPGGTPNEDKLSAGDRR